MSFTKFLDIEQFPQESRPLISDYLCPLCNGVYYNPVVDVCGHAFCKECLLKSISIQKICPITKKELESEAVHPIPFITLILDKQKVSCKNSCGWIGTVTQLSSHLIEECKKVPINCENTGCDIVILRNEKEKHDSVCDFRLITCPFCEIKISYISQKTHDNTCPKIRVDCSQMCGYVIERCELDRHINNTCENSLVECIYYKLGCEYKFLRKDLNEHLSKNMLTHNKYMVDNMVSMKEKVDKIEELEKKIKKITENNNNNNHDKDKEKDRNFALYSDKKEKSHRNHNQFTSVAHNNNNNFQRSRGRPKREEKKQESYSHLFKGKYMYYII